MLPTETRLTGLGVARALERAGVSIPVRDGYSAPERVKGFAWDRRADIFTLAVLLHELLSGRRMTAQAADMTLTENSDLDVSVLRTAFVRAMAERPDDRFGSALEFVETIGSAFVARSGSAEGQPHAATARRATDDAAFSAAAWDAISHAAPTAIRDRTGVDLDLGDADLTRYADAGIAPAVALDAAFTASPRRGSAAARAVTDAPAAHSATGEAMPVAWTSHRPAERSRLVWPMAAILAIGVGLGFAFGYVLKAPAVSTGQLNPAGESQAVASTQSVKEVPAPAATAGRDFTESTVPETPKPANPATPVNSKAAAPAAAAPPVFEGRLLVRSEPAGASVMVDGREYGSTPAGVRGRGRGTPRVR